MHISNKAEGSISEVTEMHAKMKVIEAFKYHSLAEPWFENKPVIQALLWMMMMKSVISNQPLLWIQF